MPSTPTTTGTATTAAGIELAYEAFGSSDDPTVVLVAGFGSQLLSWADGLCALLADGGRHVVRFDNRDVGCSTKLDAAVDVAEVTAAAAGGDIDRARDLAPYGLVDMAGDVVGLLDALEVDSAHVVGASMGGMIAQLVAIEHPDRTRTLTSIMSTTGEPGYGRPTPEAQAALLRRPPADRAGYVAASVESARVWSSQRFFDAEAAAEVAGRAYDRCYCPEGVSRQLAAIVSSGPRAEGLRRLDVPTLVVHGLDDTLIPPDGGRRTAELVPGAELLLVPDMGHDRPEPRWPDLAEAILRHTEPA